MKKLLSRDEYEQLLKNTPRDVCLLCQTQEQIVLGSSTHWLWIASLSPYWKFHTLFIPRKHLEDIAELSPELFEDFKTLHQKAKSKVLSLALKHDDGKPIDQFIIMIRLREVAIENGSTYPKPRHLHIHFVPDREGVERFVLDPLAIEADIEQLRLSE